ncbi:MAG: fibronectin type III domain-containing protein [Lachnospiraceae bacterium]|nr:fibronectin type III domain-containing protein [Lachnospiraceae bacterium]
MKKKIILLFLMMGMLSKPVFAGEILPDAFDESISAESIPYVEDATLSLPSSYNARTLGMTTSVKDQGDTPLCLTYARIAALETALVKKGYENASVDLSEMHMLYERWKYSNSKKPFGQWCEYSGTQTLGLESSFDNSFQLRDFPVYESQMPMAVLTDDYMHDAANAGSSPYEIKSIYLYKQDADTDQSAMVRATKEGIYRYGSVAANISYVPGSEDDEAYKFFGNGKDYTYYLPEKVSSSVGHVIQIVGWDDGYSKDNFSTRPPANGAFLCKNSWGNVGGSSGYFWMSYCSKVRIIWEGFEVAMKGTTARGIEAAAQEITLYAGQTSDPIIVKMIPESAESKEWYIDIPAGDEFLTVNNDNSISCKKFQKPASNMGDQTVSTRTVNIRSKDKTLNFSTQIKIKMLANTVKNEGTVYIADNEKADITKGLSVSPVAERKSEITYQAGTGVKIEDNRLASARSYGQTNVKAILDGQSVDILCYVYCTGFDLGDDITYEGCSNAFLKPVFGISSESDKYSDLISYTSSDENVAKVEGDFIYFVGNGQAVITGVLSDEKLTLGKTLTDSVLVTVSGMDTGEITSPAAQEQVITEPAIQDTGSYIDPYAYQPQAGTDPAVAEPATEGERVQKKVYARPSKPEKMPGTVKVKSVKAKKGGKISLSWKRPSLARRYEIQISADKSFKKSKSIYVKKEKATLKGLKSGTRYYIRVRAFGKTLCGKWSKKKSIKAR